MPQPLFIPQPYQIESREGTFTLDSLTRIALHSEASAETRFAASELAQWVRQLTGLEPAVETVAEDTTNTIILRRQEASDALVSDLGPEGYHLAIEPDTITISASGEAGLFYGVQTLAQILKTCGRGLPALAITDRPVLAQRGLMLDISRARVANVPFLKRLISLLAHYKINQFQLYTEHTFLVNRRREFGEAMGALTPEEVVELDGYCQARHVELVPNFQSFGHQRHLLSLTEYEHLAETPWKWTLSPAREETYELLDEVYGELLPLFASSQFNINCDETYDHGLGQSKSLAAERGKAQLYLDHILRLRDLAAKYGKRIQMWADILFDHPELIPAIPDDITLLDWRYENLPTYPTVEAIEKAGRRFMVCPGTSSWNTLFPRLSNALGNIQGYVRAGIEHGAIGMLNTDWGDHGHYQQPTGSFYPYVFGAETGWTGAKTSPAEFDVKVGPLLFGDWSGRVVNAMHGLARLIEHPAFLKPNRSDIAYALFDDPIAGKLVETAPDVVAELRAAAQEAMAAFASLDDEQMRTELSFTAYQMAFVADKLATSYALRAAIRNGANSLLPFADQLARQREQLVAMRAEFERLWLANSKRSEIQKDLDYYDGVIGRYDQAITWLRAGNRNLSTYSTEDYLTLWDSGEKNTLELLDLVGFEALPPPLQRWMTLVLARKERQAKERQEREQQA